MVSSLGSYEKGESRVKGQRLWQNLADRRGLLFHSASRFSGMTTAALQSYYFKGWIFYDKAYLFDKWNGFPEIIHNCLYIRTILSTHFYSTSLFIIVYYWSESFRIVQIYEQRGVMLPAKQNKAYNEFYPFVFDDNKPFLVKSAYRFFVCFLAHPEEAIDNFRRAFIGYGCLLYTSPSPRD